HTSAPHSFPTRHSSDLPGTWGEAFVAHHSMIIPIPDDIPDKIAAMFEPLSVGLHAVLRQPPKDGEHVLVIGGGMIAYTVLAAIRDRKSRRLNSSHVSIS